MRLPLLILGANLAAAGFGSAVTAWLLPLAAPARTSFPAKPSCPAPPALAAVSAPSPRAKPETPVLPAHPAAALATGTARS